MRWSKIICVTTVVATSFWGAASRAQILSQEIVTLPTQLSREAVAALLSLSPDAASQQAASPRRPHRYFFRKLHHPLTPSDVALRESVRSLGDDTHRFVRCELKDHSVVIGAIVFVGSEVFWVRPGILREDHVIRYSELGAPPRPTAAVGTHLKNGLGLTALIAVCVALLPMCIAAAGE